MACDAVPLVYHDLVNTAQGGGAGGALAGRLALVDNFLGNIALLDASPARGDMVLCVEMSAEKYWKGKKSVNETLRCVTHLGRSNTFSL